MDREKVIKALQTCSVQNDVGCQGCPYFEERKTYGHEWCTTSMAQDSLALLKEQEAVEPKHNPLSPTDWFCGKCGMCISRFHDYCPSCGQAVKWD